MWQARFLRRIDFRLFFIITLLMGISLVTISSYSSDFLLESGDTGFMTPMVKSQCKWFLIGWGIFFLFAGFDYNKLREYAWLIYAISLFALIGLFFTDPIQRVHRWYRLPFVHFNVQPSEYAKLAVIIAMSWFLERKANASRALSTTFGALLIAGVPFLLILKQPDLGTALVLFPMTLVMCYFGDLHPFVIKTLIFVGLCALTIVFVIFSGLVSHEEARPYARVFLKEYQYERLNPNTHHQKAACMAIAVGGMDGTGWKNSEYARGGSLPAPYTDSVFPAFGEEFGFLGLIFLLVLFYALIYCSFQVTAVAKDPFGRLLAAGIAIFLAVHVLVNIGMMCGLLPITGVPLVLVSYGGSSVISTMIAIGILQSIYSRRFMF
ncbi:MAG: rodA [Chlamydiia bacterium]|nr:rodA [Chlamydiia bacterium]